MSSSPPMGREGTLLGTAAGGSTAQDLSREEGLLHAQDHPDGNPRPGPRDQEPWEACGGGPAAGARTAQRGARNTPCHHPRGGPLPARPVTACWGPHQQLELPRQHPRDPGACATCCSPSSTARAHFVRDYDSEPAGVPGDRAQRSQVTLNIMRNARRRPPTRSTVSLPCAPARAASSPSATTLHRLVCQDGCCRQRARHSAERKTIFVPMVTGAPRAPAWGWQLPRTWSTTTAACWNAIANPVNRVLPSTFRWTGTCTSIKGLDSGRRQFDPLGLERAHPGRYRQRVSRTAPAAATHGFRPPDVIISDIRMPGTDGLQLLSLISENTPTCRSSSPPPIPTWTAPSHPISRGAFEYLPKPFDLDEWWPLPSAHWPRPARNRPTWCAPTSQTEIIGEAPAMQEVFAPSAGRPQQYHGAHQRRVRHRQGTRGQGLHRHSPRAQSRSSP